MLGILAFRSNNLLALTVYFLLSFLHLLWFIPSPTYTATALILSFSTLIFLLKQILDAKVNIFFILISVAYVFSFLIRPESFLFGSVITIPFVLFSLFKNINVIRKEIKYILVSLFIVFSVLGIDISFEKIYYNNNSNWTEYKDWEAARYKIQANTPEKAVLKSPTKFGWTKAEAEIFRSYNSIDPDNFTVSKLNQLILDSQNTTTINLNFLKKAHQQIFDSDINWEWKRLIELISVVFALFLISSLPKSLNYLLLSVSSLAIIYAIMLYVAGFLRQPERVQVSVIFLSILACWTSFIFSNEANSRNKLDQFSIASWLLLILVATSTFYQSSYLKVKVAGASNVFWLAQSDFLSKFPKDSVFVGNASQFRNNWISPYKVDYFEVENRIMSFGWHNFSPHWITRAQKLGLKPDDMFSSVIEDSRVYWVSDKPTMNFIVEYMKENSLEFSGPENVGVMSHFGDEYIVWDFNKND